MPIQAHELIKTVATKFPTFEEFWQEAKKYALHATLSSKDKVSFHFVSYQWYNYWKENEVYWNTRKNYRQNILPISQWFRFFK